MGRSFKGMEENDREGMRRRSGVMEEVKGSECRDLLLSCVDDTEVMLSGKLDVDC